MLEKGTIRWTIHCKDQFVSHLFLVWRRTRATERWRATTINLKDFNIFIHYKHFKMERIHLLKEILKLSMEVWPEKRLFLVSIEQRVKEICMLGMGGYPVQTDSSVFWTLPSPKVVYKINKSASRHLNRKQS